ncbi:MAG: TIGR02647 family protein [Gammaproteobacteria bacterium]|nr:TIGR02647 family protein [Gammaproteobacteria bacterium]MCP5417233.1 TIGR02647 family protein [Chromatiaceae bacterium]
MRYTHEQLEEMEILLLFNLAASEEGIKVHKTARPEAVAATIRLYEKGLITQKDGGYLTNIGMRAAEHAQQLQTILS